MRRVASHYIYYRHLFRMHYVELDDDGCLSGIYPLTEEIAGTEFYDGIVIPVPQKNAPLFLENRQLFLKDEGGFTDTEALLEGMALSGVWNTTADREPFLLFLLDRSALSAAEFSTDNSCCNRYIKRL